ESVLGSAPGTLTSLAPWSERTRWYSRLRTRRITHGLVEFLRAYARIRGPMVLCFDAAESADRTDQEFLAVALRRLDPAQVRLVIGTGAGPRPDELTDALRRYATLIDVPPADPADPADPAAPRDDLVLARAFVESDGINQDPAVRAAYDRVDPDLRARWHDTRADDLERTGEFSLRLGAIPYHRLAGRDPAGAGWEAVCAVEDYCLGMGYYDAMVENGERMIALVRQHEELSKFYHRVFVRISQALVLLERPEETEPIYHDLMARTDQPHPHMSAHYSLGMLYTRHLDEDRKDHERARAYVNTAVAIARLLPNPEDRAFHTVFMRNGLALVEMHRGDLTRSLELVTSGIEQLDRELPADRHRLHRSVLRHNRAQVLAALGRTAEAIADFDHVIELDPHYSEYYFDRGNTRSKAGDYAGAIVDYEQAMACSPPFPELYYNRGDARAALGSVTDAIADFAYVLDLEPDHIESRIALAALLLDTDDASAAIEHARAGLDTEPENARLLCLLGQAAAEYGDVDLAWDAFDRALHVDDALYAALVNRAVLAHQQGDPSRALTDLDRAVELADSDPDVLYNRGFLRETVGRYQDAIEDYGRALVLPGADTGELLRRRAACHAALGDDTSSQADLAASRQPAGPSGADLSQLAAGRTG
ncbi:MAG TPA: tetratricopeptide repeat protein, partial [Mycobacteriales bacterium]|nr:tetratricopeptide repeat protein [Mycobacteriales bacterium]